MGTVFGAALRRAGQDATLVDVSHPLVDQLTTEVRFVGRERLEPISPDSGDHGPGSLGTMDAVILFVKCYQTRGGRRARATAGGTRHDRCLAAERLGQRAHPGAGLRRERVVAGVTYHSARTRELGRVAHTSRGPTYIGPFDGGGMDAAERLGVALSGVGLETHVTPAIGTQMWQKLVLNCATLPIAALRGSGPAASDRPRRCAVLVVAAETCAVAAAAGHEWTRRSASDHPRSSTGRRRQGVDAPGRRSRPPHRDST